MIGVFPSISDSFQSDGADKADTMIPAIAETGYQKQINV
jgi:hypothetical protein